MRRLTLILIFLLPAVASGQSYTYSLATDFGGNINISRFITEVGDAAIVPVLETLSVDGDDVVTVFDAVLSGAEKTTLDGVVSSHDGTVPQERLTSLTIGELKGADFNSTSDQAIPITCVRKFIIRRIVVINPTGHPFDTAAGGVYRDTGKSVVIVPSSQTYGGLDGAAKYIDMSLGINPGSKTYNQDEVYFSLTTAQGSAATADIYILGDCFP